MIVQLHVIGTLLIVLALLHVGFPRYFGWKQDLAPLSLINRQMMRVHALFIAITVLLMGVLCVTSAADLIGTPLGQRIALLLGLFWAFRLAVQLFGYSTQLWKGKVFETAIHIVFSCLWCYVGSIFLLIAFA